MKSQTEAAKELAEVDMIIRDEISMVSKEAFKAADSLLRDILDEPNKPFGGIIAVFGGDSSNSADVLTSGRNTLNPFT